MGKIEPEVSGFKRIFFRAPKSLTVINTCLGEMEEFKGRDIAFVSDWLTKKGLQKLDHGGSWVRIQSGTRIFFRVSS